MQYAHFELQPIDTCTQAWKRRSRWSGSAAENERSSAIPNAPRATPSPLAPIQSARCGIVPGPKATSTNGYSSNRRSRWASA